VPSIVITFEPHPFEFFLGKDCQIARITNLREKFYALAKCGVDLVVILPFNQLLARISASDFVDMIHLSMQPQHLCIGDDFRFGNQRQGDFQLLQTMGRQRGFTVESIDTVLIDGERVSSTRVRTALAEGKLEMTRRLLGHAYCMLGCISGGDQLGRQLGFPTANIALHRCRTPVMGIYTVYMHGMDKRPWPGVASVGTRPTIGGTRALLEVHLLNFHRDIYGLKVCVEFCQKLRDEICFPNLNLLKEQIVKDVAATREYFLKNGVI